MSGTVIYIMTPKYKIERRDQNGDLYCSIRDEKNSYSHV